MLAISKMAKLYQPAADVSFLHLMNLLIVNLELSKLILVRFLYKFAKDFFFLFSFHPISNFGISILVQESLLLLLV